MPGCTLFMILRVLVMIAMMHISDDQLYQSLIVPAYMGALTLFSIIGCIVMSCLDSNIASLTNPELEAYPLVTLSPSWTSLIGVPVAWCDLWTLICIQQLEPLDDTIEPKTYQILLAFSFVSWLMLTRWKQHFVPASFWDIFFFFVLRVLIGIILLDIPCDAWRGQLFLTLAVLVNLFYTICIFLVSLFEVEFA
jgi:hypothetical protein